MSFTDAARKAARFALLVALVPTTVALGTTGASASVRPMVLEYTCTQHDPEICFSVQSFSGFFQLTEQVHDNSFSLYSLAVPSGPALPATATSGVVETTPAGGGWSNSHTWVVNGAQPISGGKYCGSWGGSSVPPACVTWH